jgi:hypothetical protein
MRPLIVILIGLLSLLGSACGSGMTGDCSSGPSVDCGGTTPAVHWSDARATAAATHFSYAPMVAGRLTQAHCRIVRRSAGDEAQAVCSAVFVSPTGPPTQARLALTLNGVGAVNPDCSLLWRTSPYCTARGEPATSGRAG